MTDADILESIMKDFSYLPKYEDGDRGYYDASRVGFLEEPAKLLDLRNAGIYDTFEYVQLYSIQHKGQTKYAVISAYQGSCDGCLDHEMRKYEAIR